MTPNFNSKLTIQQQAFVAEYAVHFDATKAALNAGYSKKTARNQGSQLLHNPKIQEAISKALDDYGNDMAVLKKRVVNEIATMAFSDITDLYEKAEGDEFRLKDLKALGRKHSGNIKELKVKRTTYKDEVSEEVLVKLWSKEKALELLGRHLGMFQERLEPPAPPVNADAKKVLTFEEFAVLAGYPQPFPKQVEMKSFGIDSEGARMILGARGYGKTEYVVILGVAYKIYLNPKSYRVFLVTKSRERNAAILKEIANACEKAGVTFEINNSMSLRTTGMVGKDHSISAATINSVTLRGRHPDLVIMDDPVTPDDTSEATRTKVKKVYDEILKLTKNVLIIGQPVHKFDLYQTLRPKLNKMEVAYGSIPELDADLEAQRLAQVDEASIQASYFLNIISEGTVPFDKLKFIDKFPTSENAVAFIDPAFGGKDFTAVTIMKAYMEGVAVVGFCWQRSWENCLDEMLPKLKAYGVKRMAFETNCTGDQPLDILRTAFPWIGVVGVRSNTNKHSRIIAAAKYSQMIHLSRESEKNYTNQVVQYEEKSKNDDAPDSLASCLAWLGLIRGKL